VAHKKKIHQEQKNAPTGWGVRGGGGGGEGGGGNTHINYVCV